jgi:hypothetical protein
MLGFGHVVVASRELTAARLQMLGLHTLSLPPIGRQVPLMMQF